MKKFVLVLTGIMLISFGIAWALIPRGIGFSIGSIPGNKQNVDQEKVEKLDGIGNISISTSSEDVNIIPENREDIRVHYTGWFSTTVKDYNAELIVENTGSEIKVNVKRPNFTFGSFSANLKIDVYVPSSYNKGLEISTSSGDTNIPAVVLESLDYSSSSGDLKASSLQVKDASMKSSSGDINAEGFTGKLEADSSSGKISIDYKNLDGNVNISSSSGSVRLTLPKDSSFNINAASSSGDIKCDFPVSNGKFEKKSLTGTIGSGSHNLTIRTSSGSIRVESK